MPLAGEGRPTAAARIHVLMSTLAAASTRRLPRGWAHLVLQFGFWIGFYFVYQAARGLADREGVATAFANGEWIIEFQRSLHSMFELTLQRVVEGSGFLIQATSITYWLSQFAVVGLALTWVYSEGARPLLRLPEHADRREPDRPPRLRAPADGAAADVRRRRLHRHARRALDGEPLLDVRRVLVEPVRGDAEPARARRADRQRRDGDRSCAAAGRSCSGSRGRRGSGSR